jgi:hypothetical protein
VAFDVTVQLRVNRAAKEFKRATLELEIRLVPNVDEFFYAFIFLFAVYRAKTCPYYDVDKYVAYSFSSARVPYGNVYMKI